MTGSAEGPISIIAGLVMAGLVVAQGQDIFVAGIGDSYASGNGAGDYSDELCVRSESASVAIAADFFGGDAVNAACNGAWVVDLLEPRIISETRRDYDPPNIREQAEAECTTDMVGVTPTVDVDGTTAFCTLTLDPQVDVVAGASDVFVTIGGNNIGFVPVAGMCFLQSDEELCREAVEDARSALVPTLDQQRGALVALREAAPNARIHLVPYPRMLSGEHSVGSYDVTADINQLQSDWEDALREMAGELNTELGEVYYVETLTPLWEGHGLGGADSWIHTNGRVGELLHPTAEGWEATGAAYIAHLGHVILG